jgi:predicted alpha/beta hydrolase family esterase
MPGTEDDPHYGPWRERLGSELAAIDGEPILFGHSLGASVALKYLAEEDPGEIAGLVLATTPYWGTEGWEHEWALPEGWPKEGTRLPPTFLFHSRDDEELPFEHLERYAALLPEATVGRLDGNGHLYDRGDLSEIVEAVRSL